MGTPGFLKKVMFGAVLVLAAPSALWAQTEVVYEGYVAERYDRLNQLEQEYERRFRATGHTDLSAARSTFRFNNARFAHMEWAGERLIPDLDAYSVTHLLERLVDYNETRLSPGERKGDVRLSIRKLFTADNNIAVFSGHSTYAKGKIEILGDNGAVLESHEVLVNFLERPIISRNYDGPDLAFFTTDPNERVGPVLAEFVRKAFEKVYPETRFARTLVVAEPVDF